MFSTALQPRVTALEELLITKLSAEKVPPRSFFTLSLWMADKLPIETEETFCAIEKELGEEKANLWLCGVLAKTKHFVADADGFVQAVLA